MALTNVTVEEQLPAVADILSITIDRYITLAATNCGYSGIAEELVVNYDRPLFLEAKDSVRK